VEGDPVGSIGHHLANVITGLRHVVAGGEGGKHLPRDRLDQGFPIHR
jgi:hypothetical protein